MIGDNFEDMRKSERGLIGYSWLGDVSTTKYDIEYSDKWEMDYYDFEDGCLTGFFGKIEDGVIT
jgi:hypothetical protein